MSLKTTDYSKTLEIVSRKALEAELDRVVDDAVQHALANPGHGILVTRHRPGSFTVELSGKVPQGTIAELDLTTHRPSSDPAPAAPPRPCGMV